MQAGPVGSPGTTGHRDQDAHPLNQTWRVHVCFCRLPAQQQQHQKLETRVSPPHPSHKDLRLPTYHSVNKEMWTTCYSPCATHLSCTRAPVHIWHCGNGRMLLFTCLCLHLFLVKSQRFDRLVDGQLIFKSLGWCFQIYCLLWFLCPIDGFTRVITPICNVWFGLKTNM